MSKGCYELSKNLQHQSVLWWVFYYFSISIYFKMTKDLKIETLNYTIWFFNISKQWFMTIVTLESNILWFLFWTIIGLQCSYYKPEWTLKTASIKQTRFNLLSKLDLPDCIMQKQLYSPLSFSTQQQHQFSWLLM